MSNREAKARCDQCGRIGHFKKNCQRDKLKQKEVVAAQVEEEPAPVVKEIANEDKIRQFLERCSTKYIFRIYFEGTWFQGTKYDTGRQNYLDFCLDDKYDKLRSLNNCVTFSGRYHSRYIPHHMHDDKIISRKILQRLIGCKSVDDVLLCFRTYPIFTKVECNFYELLWEDLIKKLKEIGEIDFEDKSHIKHAYYDAKLYTRIGDRRVSCYSHALPDEERSNIISLYATYLNFTTDAVKLMLSDTQEIDIIYQ